MTDSKKKQIEDGAKALFEEANHAAFSKQPKVTQETFRRYAEAAITGQTTAERKPEGETPADDSGA